MKNTEISWCDHTFNPWTGCAKVSPGCLNCYAEGWAKRSGIVKWGGPRRRTTASNWNEPRKWNRDAQAALAAHSDECAKDMSYGQHVKPPARPRVFCASLADWLDDEVPVEWLADLLELIAATPDLDWLLLTKRPQNFAARTQAVSQLSGRQASILAMQWGGWGNTPPNVWVGTTVEDQQRADERIPALLKIPARVRFLSCEPLLGPVNLTVIINNGLGRDALRVDDASMGDPERHVDWVICGGESGPGARPMHPDWARSLRDQCAAAGVAFHFKQWGGVNKKEAGRILDGETFDQFPAIAENIAGSQPGGQS